MVAKSPGNHWGVVTGTTSYNSAHEGLNQNSLSQRLRDSSLVTLNLLSSGCTTNIKGLDCGQLMCHGITTEHWLIWRSHNSSMKWNWRKKMLIKNFMNMSWMNHWHFTRALFFIDHESDLSLCQQLFDKHETPQSRTSALLDQCTCLTSYVHNLRLATFHLLRNARA